MKTKMRAENGRLIIFHGKWQSVLMLVSFAFLSVSAGSFFAFSDSYGNDSQLVHWIGYIFVALGLGLLVMAIQSIRQTAEYEGVPILEATPEKFIITPSFSGTGNAYCWTELDKILFPNRFVHIDSEGKSLMRHCALFMFSENKFSSLGPWELWKTQISKTPQGGYYIAIPFPADLDATSFYQVLKPFLPQGLPVEFLQEIYYDYDRSEEKYFDKEQDGSLDN